MQKVLFVGSFKSSSKDGSVGGQMFACNTIMNSKLSEEIEWTLIDTTSDSSIIASLSRRFFKAIKRLFIFCFYIAFKRFDKILIFTGDGYSFWEKGMMSVLAKSLTKSKVILAPRSGIILNDINKNGYLAKFIKFVLRRVDLVLCQSITWKRYFGALISNVNSDKFIIIENWIDIKPYKDLPILHRSINEPVTILFLSWLDTNKGIYELINATKMLKKHRSDFKVLIAGMGEAYYGVINEIKNESLQDCIELYGWAIGSDKISVLRRSDIFVLPSYFEGFPNSLMEAMAAGKACIATNVGSIPDMITNKVNGLIIKQKNAVDLFEKINYLLDNPEFRTQLSHNARKRMKRNSVEAAILKLKSILID